MVYIGWNEAEAGRALVATDLQGNVLWRNSIGQITAADLLALSDGILFLKSDSGLYRLDAKTGRFTAWTSNNDASINPLTVWAGAPSTPRYLDGLGADNGKVYFSFASLNAVVSADSVSGAFIKAYTVPSPGMMKVGAAPHDLYRFRS